MTTADAALPGRLAACADLGATELLVSPRHADAGALERLAAAVLTGHGLPAA